MKKKIKDWLEELPDGYRELALASFNSEDPEINSVHGDKDLYQSMSDALYAAFIWGSEHSFWSEVNSYYLGLSDKLPDIFSTANTGVSAISTSQISIEEALKHLEEAEKNLYAAREILNKIA